MLTYLPPVYVDGVAISLGNGTYKWSSGYFSGDVSAATGTFTGNVTTIPPTLTNHAATKGYVDGLVTVAPVLSIAKDPPASPTTGDRYAVTYIAEGAPSGAWVGYSGYVAEWSGSAWVFTAIAEGRTVYCTVDADFLGNPGFVASTDSGSGYNTFNAISYSIDHGTLLGRDGDDHWQYSLADGTRAFTGVVVGVTPTLSTHLATKGYVDSAVSGAGAYLVDGTIPLTATFNVAGYDIGTSGTPAGMAYAEGVATPRQSTLTISSGAITVTGSYHLIDTEGAAATDTLSTISGGTDGQHLFLRIASASRTVTINENGNIRMIGVETAFDVVDSDAVVELIYDGTSTTWYVVAALSSAYLCSGENALTGSLNAAGHNIGIPGDPAGTIYHNGIVTSTASRTISGGAISVTGVSAVKVYAEGGAASDTLDTINGGADGQLLWLECADSAQDITLDSSGSSIVIEELGGKLVLGTLSRGVLLRYSGARSRWMVIAVSPGVSRDVYRGYYQTIADDGVATIEFDADILVGWLDFSSSASTLPAGRIQFAAKTTGSFTVQAGVSNASLLTTNTSPQVLTGVTGVDGQLTITAANRVVYLENRTGAGIILTYQVVAM